MLRKIISSVTIAATLLSSGANAERYNRDRHERVERNNIAPFIGGLAGGLLGGIIIDRFANPTPRYPNYYDYNYRYAPDTPYYDPYPYNYRHVPICYYESYTDFYGRVITRRVCQ